MYLHHQYLISNYLHKVCSRIKLLHKQLEDKNVKIKKMKQRLENADEILRRCEKSKKILINRIKRLNRLREIEYE